MKKRRLYQGISCLLLALFFYFLSDLFSSLTDGFSIQRITSHFPQSMSQIKWNAPSPCLEETSEVNNALGQSYRYLGCGGQCFAFLSEDNQYVLKLFKTHFYHFGSLFFQTLPYIPKEKRDQKFAKALFKLKRDFNSYLIASRDLKDETGILYLHLDKGSDMKKKIRLTDKIGIAHELELDQHEFAIQRRAELAYPYLHSLIQQNDLEKARSAMRSLIDLSLDRCRKGFYDEDARVHCNFGFIGDRPIFIDIGRFVIDPSRQQRAIYEKDIAAIAHQLREWVSTNYPQLTAYFNETLDSIDSSM